MQVLQLLRGTAAEVAAYTPAVAEPVYNKDTKALTIGDGATLGGTSILSGHANVLSLDGLTLAADTLPYGTGVGTLGTTAFTPLARTLVAGTTNSGMRTTLGAAASGANTDITSITGSAATLTTTRSIALSGDATWSVNFDGSANATAALTLATTGVAAGTYNSVTVDTTGRVTASADTAFVNVPLNNSWKVQPSRRAVYRKTGDIVHLEVNITGGTATDGTTVITLPTGFRTPSEFSIPVRSTPAATPSPSVAVPAVVVRTNGTIGCVNCTAAGGINFVCSFSTI